MQSNGKVPRVAKVRETTTLFTRFTSAGAPACERLKITLCGTPEMLNRTVPPTVIVVLKGLNTLPGVKTSAMVVPDPFGGVTGGDVESAPQATARDRAVSGTNRRMTTLTRGISLVPLSMKGRLLPSPRNFWRLPALVVAATLALACGGEASGPGRNPVGKYDLATFNAKALPVTLFADTGFTLALTAGTLSLDADGSFLSTISVNETVEGHKSVYVDTAAGRWTQAGATMLFTGADSLKQAGAWDGARITLTDTTTRPPSTFVFARR